MKEVPLSPLPSQTFQVTCNGQQVTLSVYTKSGYDLTDPTLSTPNQNIYADVSYVDTSGTTVTVTTTAICLNQKRLLVNRQYLGFVGDFMFIDTQGTSDPQYAGLGTRWVLLYLEAADLP